MSAGEEAARRGLGKSVDDNRMQMAMTDESRVLLAGMLREEMRVAVAKGIESALTSEAMWTKVFVVLQKQATERTGRFVLGGLTIVVRKAMWVGAFALIAYSVGGWTLVKAAWAALNKG